jgi:cytochrome c oxidase subunit IV
MSAGHAHASQGAGHVSPISLYVTIFLALMVLTGVTVGAAYVDLGQFNFLVAMIIAVFKASLVVWYFMHVKYQSKLTKLTVATGLFFLAILLGLMLVDYGSKGFTPMLPSTDASGQMGGAAAH